MKQHISVGIDIGTFTTKIVVVDTTKEGSHIIATAAVESRGIRQGYVVDKQEATNTLLKAVAIVEKETKLRIKSVSLAIGGIGIGSEYVIGSTTATRADGIIGKYDIENAITNAEQKIDSKNKAILHAFPIAFKVDDKEFPTRPDGMLGSKLEVKTLFITCFQQHLDDLLSVAHDAGLRVESFIATPIATQKLLLTDLQRNFGCIVIDIGAETVSTSIYENNMLTAVHVFNIGSSHITKDIAIGLRITPEEAENLKLGVVSSQQFPKKKLDEIIEARISDIFELIDKYLKKVGRSGLLPSGALLIGGGSQIINIEEMGKTMLKIPVRKGQIDMPSLKGTSKDYRYMVAYNTALLAVDNEPLGSSKSSFITHEEGFLTVIKDFLKQLLP